MREPEPTRPPWLKVRAPGGKKFNDIKGLLKKLQLTTVCEEALCPNIEECWNGGTATFMLMGDTCTRACRFCAVKTGNPAGTLDHSEPRNVGEAIAHLNLDYVVLTSVDRDDLEDLGSQHFAETVRVIKSANPKIIVETLTPDFNAIPKFVKKIIDANVDVFAHNVETVERLTPRVRDRRSGYRQSLATLEIAKKLRARQYTKSSVMLGLGEKHSEVLQTMSDLRSVGVDVITFGQYLSPTNRHKKYLPIERYVTPKEFDQMGEEARAMGFLYVASGPLVRSSYRAGELFLKGMIESERKSGPLPVYPSLKPYVR